MVKGKLILICQSRGEFATSDDGSLSYNGGEAHALDICPETLLDDLKLKLAEMCNMEYKSLSLKYFLPGNKRTLINLSNDKDLKRMYDYHDNSVTAEVYVTGREGFDLEAFDMDAERASGIKLAETVTTKMATQAIASPVASRVAKAAARPRKSSVATPAESVMAVNATPQSRSRKLKAPAHSSSDEPATDSFILTGIDAVAEAAAQMDMSASPADTVKKRRRTASWRFGANGPTIVAVSDDEDQQINSSRRKLSVKKRNTKIRSPATESDEEEQEIYSDDEEQEIYSSPDSSDCASPKSDNVDLEKQVALWRKGIRGEGQEFKNVQDFRDALQKYAIAHRFAYKLKKNDTNRASGTCVTEGCPWRIHASWVTSAQVFRIKKMHKSHTCSRKSWETSHPAKNWLVSIIKERLKDSPHHKPKQIADGIFQDFGIKLNYSQVWRGIEDAREQLQGSYKEAYSLLPWYCDKINEANPGSFTKLLIGDDRKFQCLFLSFHAAVHGFQNGCRPLLFLEATSMKSKYHEMLLTATALDGDDSVFPVALAIVDVENDDSWRWFLEQLKFAVSTSQSITFVSDKDKGLRKFVLEVFENAHHAYSIYYLMDNFIKNLKGPFNGEGRASLPGSLLAAANAVRHDSFKMFMEQVKRVSSKAYDWLMENEPEFWANVYFKGELYNHITFDIAESYANWIEEARELPITQKVEFLRQKMMELMKSRQTNSSKWSTKLTPSKEEKLREESEKARGLKVLFSSDTLFEVHDISINVVDLDRRECSCVTWKATGLPCRHAIAVFNCTRRSVYDYCSRYFTVDNFQSTYSESINPASAIVDTRVKETAVSEDDQVLPPKLTRYPAHQYKIRRGKSHGIIRRSVCCTKCKGVGHNKASCKEAQTSTRKDTETSTCNEMDTSTGKETEASTCKETSTSTCKERENSTCKETEISTCKETEASTCKEMDTSTCKETEAFACKETETSTCKETEASMR